MEGASTFFAQYQESVSRELASQESVSQESESDEESIPSGYHAPNEKESCPKRQRYNIIRPPRPQKRNYNMLQLSSGRVMRFDDDDEDATLVPRWFESNPYVRRILSRIPFSIERRLKYLARIMHEEDGYDSDGEIIYYHLRDQVYESFLVELRLRRAMRNVLTRWRINRLDRVPQERTDPITLYEPVKEVVLYDMKVRKKFYFDAKSIAIHIETALLYQEGGFAIPMYPRNPWNNVEFSYPQLVSLYLQLRAHGELRWGFSTLRALDFSKSRWHKYHHSAITMRAIHTSLFALDSLNARELLEDFIILSLEQFGAVSENTVLFYREAMVRIPRHWYLERWKTLAYQHYEAQHFGLHRSIHTACRELYKKQSTFIKELVNQGIIRKIDEAPPPS